ncbi:MAG: type III pantothenate kinase [Gammaproteobacteria bacterium]|nr:type III pantothenate kinase [Gammaproteobacteria bacterium]
MKLLLDVGNSRIKSALCEEGRLHSYQACQYSKREIEVTFDSMLSERTELEQIVVASVAGKAVSSHIRTYFSRHCSAGINFIESSHEAKGVTNAYAEPAQLGVDRWLAMIAAWNYYKAPLCVVDCGTAVTIDFVSNEGHHLGGYIVPGTYLMAASLDANTQQISINSAVKDVTITPGLNTESCIKNGVVLTMKSLVEAACLQFTKTLESTILCVLTGGDAEQLMTSLDVDVEFEPHLVLNGIAILTGDAG